MNVCRIKTKKYVSKLQIEEMITFAVISAECTFGKPKVRINGAYIAVDNRAAIDVSSEVGEHIAQVFIGLLSREIGETSFKVNRMKDDSLKE